MLWIFLCFWLFPHLWSAGPWQTQTATNSASVRTGMTLKYSITQLLELRHYSTPTCISALKQLGILRRSCFIHRSSRRKFVYSQSADSIPSLWSAERTVALFSRHHNTAAYGTNSSSGNTARPLHTKRDRKRGVDFSLLLPLHSTVSSSLKIELFNTQSLTNKSCLIHDHILDRGIDLMCLTET